MHGWALLVVLLGCLAPSAWATSCVAEQCINPSLCFALTLSGTSGLGTEQNPIICSNLGCADCFIDCSLDPTMPDDVFTCAKEGGQVPILEGDDSCCTTDCPTGLDVCPTSGVNSDPVVMGLKGQAFLFKGLHAKWFAALAEKHLQWNWLLHVFEECENGLLPTYVTRHGITLFSEDGLAEYEIDVGVKDVTKYNPGCPAGEGDACLGQGSLEMIINGETVTSPGEYELENGASVRAFNNVGACQIKRDRHMMHRLEEEEEQLRLATQRRLVLDEEDPASTADLRALDVLEARLYTMEDREACSAWIAEKRTTRDLFDSPGSWASVYINTSTYAFQIDYRQETERSHAHVVDATILLSPNDQGVEEWSGVLGETQSLKLDSATGQAVKGRDAILSSPHDEDYIVDGPWGTAFPARGSS